MDQSHVSDIQTLYAFPKLEDQLTVTERIVVSRVLRGMSNQQIASERAVELKTVKFHLTNIFRKLEIKTRFELIAREGRAREEQRARRLELASMRGLIAEDGTFLPSGGNRD